MRQNRFDLVKDAANREKHQLPLVFGDRIIPSIRKIDGEERFKVVGSVGGEKLFTAVFVWRGHLPRFISVRRSNKGEERAYHAAC